MRFRVIDFRKNNDRVYARIDTGIISFHVEVKDIGGRLQIIKPADIFFPNPDDFRKLTGAVLGEYRKKEFSMGEFSNNEKTETILWWRTR